MKIVELHAENVKRLKAVSIKPDGDLVVIGGANDQGKTSVLDSIAYALGGKALMCGKPLRKGAAKGVARVDLGELVVTRDFKRDGSSALKVESRTAGELKSPQKILDKLLGTLTFDPLAFSRQKPRDQVETLRGLAGLDFTPLDKERADKYEARTLANRGLKQGEARLADLEHHPDAPKDEILLTDLMAKLQAAHGAKAAVTELRTQHADQKREAEHQDRRRLAAVSEIERAEAAIAAAKAVRDDALADALERQGIMDILEKEVIAAEDALPDVEAIQQEISTAEETNYQVRVNCDYADQLKMIEESEELVAKLTGRIDAIDAEKAQLISEAPFPVDGLGFDEDGVTMMGQPFDQASGAQQLRISVGVGLALNPDLKVLLIRDGSLLDTENLGLVAQLAGEADAQVWIERVGVDGATSVVIEDGLVRADRADEAVE